MALPQTTGNNSHNGNGNERLIYSDRMNNNEWQTLISIPADFVRRRWQFQFPYFISDNMVPSAATQSSPSLNIRSQTVTATHKAKPKSANNKIPIPLCEWSEKPKLRKKRFAMERQQTTQKKMFISLICVCVCVCVVFRL